MKKSCLKSKWQVFYPKVDPLLDWLQCPETDNRLSVQYWENKAFLHIWKSQGWQETWQQSVLPFFQLTCWASDHRCRAAHEVQPTWRLYLASSWSCEDRSSAMISMYVTFRDGREKERSLLHECGLEQQWRRYHCSKTRHWYWTRMARWAFEYCMVTLN